MSDTFNYETLVLRNSGYISAETQAKIRHTKLLIAGCGIGSSVVLCATRMGFENFILVDGDVVDAHNLNRQFYDFADVGRPKVEALKEKVLRVNPQAKVEAINAYLDADNTDAIVGTADIVFDTVDFLDLPAILRLHSSALRQGAHVFTALSVGFGALVWYFPAGCKVSMGDLMAPDMELAKGSSHNAASYAAVFETFIRRLVPHLDREVVEQVEKVLGLMKDGRPCPAPQVAVGSFAIAAMAMSMIHDLLAGNPVPASPQLLLHSFRSQQTKLIDLSL